MSEEQKPDNGWISVTTKLPENYTDVLVFNRSGFQHVAHFNRPNFLYKEGGIKSVRAEGHRDITHWQPLPPAPKQDK